VRVPWRDHPAMTLSKAGGGGPVRVSHGICRRRAVRRRGKRGSATR
jgi:hypothetical protein